MADGRAAFQTVQFKCNQNTPDPIPQIYMHEPEMQCHLASGSPPPLLRCDARPSR